MNTSSDSINSLPSPDITIVHNLPLLLSVSAISSLSVLINCRVFYIVFVISKHKYRPANTLVAHLSFLVIGYAFVILLLILGYNKVFNLQTLGLCRVLTFFIFCLNNVVSLNFAAIVWVRTRKNAGILRRSVAYRIIGIMWTIVLVSNLPKMLMVEDTTRPGERFGTCRRKLLMGSLEATILYEGLRFFFFTVIVCFYLIRVSTVITSSMRHIQSLDGKVMTRKIQKVRFVHWHTLICALLWFPCGVCTFLYPIFAPYDWATQFIKYVASFIFVVFICFIFCPLSYVLMLEKINLKQILVPCFLSKKLTSSVTVDKHEQMEAEAFSKKENQVLRRQPGPPRKKSKSVNFSKNAKTEIRNSLDKSEVVETSMLTTVGLTPTSSTPWSVSEISFMILSETSTCSQDSSIPSTACKPQHVAVEMHAVVDTTKNELEIIRGDMYKKTESPDEEYEILRTKHNSETLI